MASSDQKSSTFGVWITCTVNLNEDVIRGSHSDGPWLLMERHASMIETGRGLRSVLGSRSYILHDVAFVPDKLVLFSTCQCHPSTHLCNEQS